MENEGINNQGRFNENLYLRVIVNNKLKHKFIQSARSQITHTNTKDYEGQVTKQHIQILKVTRVIANE